MWRAHLLATAASLALAAASAPSEPSCDDLATARVHFTRLRLAELEYAEDVHREAHWNALGQCPGGRAGQACRAGVTGRYDAIWQARRAEIDATYRRELEDFEARCRAGIARAGERA
jgi:hypothetical protein